MLHHVLEVSGWQSTCVEPGEHYAIADLHPMPLFGCARGAADEALNWPSS